MQNKFLFYWSFALVFVFFTANSDVQVFGDIEGSLDKILSAINMPGSIVAYSKDVAGRYRLDFVDANQEHRVVVIGDAIDKGPDNIKILMMFTDFKKRYPERVFLILGNRDINKLRFNWELADGALDLRSDNPHKNSFDRFRVGDWEAKFKHWLAVGKNKIDGGVVRYYHGQDPAHIENDKILKLKFLLQETMGCPDTFDLFKKELSSNGARINDKKVADFMIAMPKPGGVLADYLKHAQLAYLDKNTGSIYVHGGISQDSLFKVPAAKSGGRDLVKDKTVQDWIQELNKWGRKGIYQGIEGKAGHHQRALSLIKNQEPEVQTVDVNGEKVTTWGNSDIPVISNFISVVQGRPWGPDYNLAPVDEQVRCALLRDGISTLVFGHSPIGEIPVIVKSRAGADEEFRSVATDTSLAKPFRNALVIVRENCVDVTADFYTKDAVKRVKYSSRDPQVGTQDKLGNWNISLDLQVKFHEPFKNAGFGVPIYSGALATTAGPIKAKL